MPGWIVSVRGIFLNKREFLSYLVLFYLLHLGFQVFHSEKLQKIAQDANFLEWARQEENLEAS